MCMEDITIGRHTSDMTRSIRYMPESLDGSEVLVIAPNQYRTGLLLFGDFYYQTESEGTLLSPHGLVEVWVDDAPASSVIGEEYNRLLCCLTEADTRLMMRIEEYGLLVQRRFTMRLVTTFVLGALINADGRMSYTEFVTPEATKYDWKPSDGPTHSYR